MSRVHSLPKTIDLSGVLAVVRLLDRSVIDTKVAHIERTYATYKQRLDANLGVVRDLIKPSKRFALASQQLEGHMAKIDFKLFDSSAAAALAITRPARKISTSTTTTTAADAAAATVGRPRAARRRARQAAERRYRQMAGASTFLNEKQHFFVHVIASSLLQPSKLANVYFF